MCGMRRQDPNLRKQKALFAVRLRSIAGADQVKQTEGESMSSRLQFAEQLTELLRQADDPYCRMINGLKDAIAIMQEGQRQAVDDAVEHLLAVIQPQPSVPLGQHRPPALTEQQRLDQEFAEQRYRAQMGQTTH